MTFFRSRRGAIVVLAVAVVFGVGFGGFRSIRSEQRSVEKIFWTSAQEPSQARVDVGLNLVSLARQVGVNAEAVSDVCLAIRESEDVNEICQLQNKLTEIFPAEAFEAAALSEADRKTYNSLRQQFDSWLFVIEKSEYTVAAQDFNRNVNRVGGLFGIDDFTTIGR